uniref:Uncharacterized protein n=1 Tax=viral metagenome TaxID=1070528 RepID=A0A6C0AG70_9ZZZZ
MNNINEMLVAKNGDLNMDKMYDNLVKDNNKCVFLLNMIVEYPALQSEQKLIDYNNVQARYYENKMYINFSYNNDSITFIYIYNYPESKIENLIKNLDINFNGV